MAYRFFESESDSISKGSYEQYDDTMDLAAKYKSAVPINKSKKPKRNRSAFIIYSSEMRTKLRTDKQAMNSNEMMVQLASMWKELDEETRQIYFDKAEKEKIKYLLELNEFYQTFPFEIIQNKTKRNHVKKPCSAYAIFLKEMKQTIKDENPTLKMADILKIVGERWKSLEESKKALYKN